MTYNQPLLKQEIAAASQPANLGYIPNPNYLSVPSVPPVHLPSICVNLCSSVALPLAANLHSAIRIHFLPFPNFSREKRSPNAATASAPATCAARHAETSLPKTRKGKRRPVCHSAIHIGPTCDLGPIAESLVRPPAPAMQTAFASAPARRHWRLGRSGQVSVWRTFGHQDWGRRGA